MIHLRNVSVRWHNQLVLANLNWCLEPMQQWAIVGPNGAGKSTLLAVLGGKKSISSGSITHSFGTEPLRNVVEMVAADFSFNALLRSAAQYYQQRFQTQDLETTPTVRALLSNQMRPIGTINHQSVRLLASEISEDNLLRIARLLQIEHLLNQAFITLSNGETRRMFLAKSLLRNPRVLLLDNPFAGLDTHSREVLRGALATLVANGTQVVLATTPLEIPNFISHVLELEAGQSYRESTSSDFMARSVGKNAVLLPPTLIPEPAFTAFEWTIQMRNVSVKYGNKMVLNNVNWQVQKGEKWALLGPNGSGKSTLLSILTADNPQRFANDYALFDQKRGGVSMWDVKQKIGHVSPEVHLYFPTDAPVLKVIASGLFDATGLYRKLSEVQQQRVNETAEWVGIGALLSKTFSQLSKGQQRVVLLARALVKNPPLLILDEPCQGLDAAAVENFKNLIDSICASPQRTLLYVTHYAHEIPTCVTKTLRLNEGKVL